MGLPPQLTLQDPSAAPFPGTPATGDPAHPAWNSSSFCLDPWSPPGSPEPPLPLQPGEAPWLDDMAPPTFLSARCSPGWGKVCKSQALTLARAQGASPLGKPCPILHFIKGMWGQLVEPRKVTLTPPLPAWRRAPGSVDTSKGSPHCALVVGSLLQRSMRRLPRPLIYHHPPQHEARATQCMRSAKLLGRKII